MASGRIPNLMDEALDRLLRKFQFLEIGDATQVPQLAEWTAKARRVLELTRPTRDLSESDERFILAAGNSDWDAPDLITAFGARAL